MPTDTLSTLSSLSSMDPDILDHLLQLVDAVLHQALGVLGLVVLTVLGQVAVAAGFLDFLGQLLAADRLEVFQLFLYGLEDRRQTLRFPVPWI